MLLTVNVSDEQNMTRQKTLQSFILLVYYIISITSKRSQDNLFGWFFYSVVRLVVTVFPQKFVFVKPDSTVLLVEANVRVSMVFAMEVWIICHSFFFFFQSVLYIFIFYLYTYSNY